MIKIPFDRCVILTTLDFEQISQRLATAIYDPRFPTSDPSSSLKRQRYYGQIRGFKFFASQPIVFKHLYLPFFLFPTIEGNVNALATGYEISLTAKLQNLALILLLTGLGGILSTCAIGFERVLLNIHDALYTKSLVIFVLFYFSIIVYIYFAAWRTTRFFRSLFTEGLTGISKMNVPQRQKWSPELPQTKVPKPSSDRFDS
jgi:hypothetical protein